MPSRPVLAICVMFINALFCTLLAEVVPVDELNPGLAWWGVFPTLNISTRNAMFHLSVIETAFWMLMSPLISPGPRKTFSPQFPKAVAEGAEKEEGSYHCKIVPSCFGVPIQLARWNEPIALRFWLATTLKGLPVKSLNTVLICQPPRILIALPVDAQR